MQVSHVRSLHTNGCVQQQQQQGAVAQESEPSPRSVFRAQENDPVSMSDSISHSVLTTAQAKDLSVFSWIVFVLHFVTEAAQAHCCALCRRASLRNKLDSITRCRRHTFALCSLTASLGATDSRYVSPSHYFWIIEFLSRIILSCALGKDVQWSLCDGEVSSSGGYLLFKENRLQ